MAETLVQVDGGETISELDALKLENTTLKNELAAKNSSIAGLEAGAAVKDNEIASLKQSLAGSEKTLEAARNALGEAVAAYKELIVQANLGLVAEMINGDSIKAIDESTKNSQTLVEKVKQQVAAENARVRVPAGAPQRTPLDLSAMSSREKIRYAMEGG